MMHRQHLQPSWQYHNTTYSPFDMDDFMGDYELSSSFTTTEDSCDASSICYFPIMNPENSIPVASLVDDVSFMNPSEYYSPGSNDSGLISSDPAVFSNEFENVLDWIHVMEASCETSLPSQNIFTGEGYESSLCSSTNTATTSPDITSIQSSLVFPNEEMEIDNQSIIPSLLKAYGEAIENEQADLADVIARHVKEKVSPMGTTMERLAYHLFQASKEHGDYLLQESRKNFFKAFSTFYHILPHGRFAHLTANMAILESIPADAETIHIIDFDMGDGVQFPSLIESIGRGRVVRLTSIKWNGDCNSPHWNFQDTKRKLQYLAQSVGLQLEVDEKDMEELVIEQRKMKTKDRKKEWLVFNCMVGLPHMGRQRSRVAITKFLKEATDLICCEGSDGPRGIITLGEGEGMEEKIRNCSGFGSFFEDRLVHYHALIQSLEWHFPSHLADARIAMEHLFVAPFISSLPYLEKWEEIKDHGSILKSVTVLESWRFSEGNLHQAKHIVNEGYSMYSVKVEGVNQNVMSLEFRGCPLVKVLTWG